MVQSLQLGGAQNTGQSSGMRRVNRLPVIIVIVLAILLLAVIFFGLAGRGLYFGNDAGIDQSTGTPASTYADQLKQGVTDGIIGEPKQTQNFQPTPVETRQETKNNPFSAQPTTTVEEKSELEPDAAWRARLQREQEEQYLRERQRQRMARLQANAAAFDAPLALDRSKLEAKSDLAADRSNTVNAQNSASSTSMSDLYSAALRNGLGGQNVDPNGQTSKESFFNTDIKELGYLPNQVVPQQSPYELKRGSVIPATLISGINSDLPGGSSRRSARTSTTAQPATIFSSRRARSCSAVMIARSRSARAACLSSGPISYFPTAQLCRSAVWPARMRRAIAASTTG